MPVAATDHDVSIVRHVTKEWQLADTSIFGRVGPPVACSVRGLKISETKCQTRQVEGTQSRKVYDYWESHHTYSFIPKRDQVSNFPCNLTRNITSHSKENLAFHSLLRWKMIILPILTTHFTYTFLFERFWEMPLFELGSENWALSNSIRISSTSLQFNHVRFLIAMTSHSFENGLGKITTQLEDLIRCFFRAREVCFLLSAQSS